MREYIKYLSIITIVSLMSCQKQTLENDRMYAEGGLISFSTKVETKAPIIENLNEDSFGVYGYNYSSLTNWNTYKAQATPNTFYKQLINCDSNGACSYTYQPIVKNNVTETVDPDNFINGQKKWELNQKYAFFAYYPYTAPTSYPSPGALVPSPAEQINVPYIEYTLPIKNGDSVDPDNLLDIMTSRVLEYSATLGTVVRFVFNHRLFCIELNGNNFNETEVKVSDLSMTISGIHYNKTKIYMDNSLPSESELTSESESTETGTYTATFPLITADQTKIVEPGKGATSLSGLNGEKNVVLIPQDSSNGATKLKVEVKFKKDNADSYTIRSSEFDINFIEGKKYSLTINFIGQKVLLVEADPLPWDSKNINHSFD